MAVQRSKGQSATVCRFDDVNLVQESSTFMINSAESDSATWQEKRSLTYTLTHTHTKECGECLKTKPLHDPLSSLLRAAGCR